MALVIGMMTGTSTDGIDAVLADIQDLPQGVRIQALGHIFMPMPDTLRKEILALNQRGDNELHRAAMVSHALAQLHVQAVEQLLEQTQYQPSEIEVIGVHGQTVRHCPDEGYTIQLNHPSYIAEYSRIDVVADFRTRDLVLGGQGAPLAPLFHQLLFAPYWDKSQTRLVLNLGGIANLSVFEADRCVGLDTGPANMLMDYWTFLHQGKSYDQNGAWALTGKVNEALLAYLIDQEPWFALPAPKSTGRDLFHAQWLSSRLAHFPTISAVDVQATLCALTAQTVVDAVARLGVSKGQWIACGGGAKNPVLMQMIETCFSKQGIDLERLYPEKSGLAVDQIEALGFAYLAWANRRALALDTCSLTGSKKPHVLGVYYPA